MSTLSIVCVTKAKPAVHSLLWEMDQFAAEIGAEMIFGTDGDDARQLLDSGPCVPVEGDYLEAMLQPVIDAARGDYILRLDDDERVPDVMKLWLRNGFFNFKESWFFPRYHLWPDTRHVITTPPFFPDFQVRLTTKAKAGRAPTLHSGSPFPSYRAPVYFEHHAFLVKTKEERRAITARYESLIKGVPFAPEQVDVVMPEDGKDLISEPLTDDLQDRSRAFRFWREAGESLPSNLERELINWQSAKPIRVKL